MSIEDEVIQQQQRNGPLFPRGDDLRVTRGEDHKPWGRHIDIVVRLGNKTSGAGAHKIRVGPNSEIITDEIV